MEQIILEILTIIVPIIGVIIAGIFGIWRYEKKRNIGKPSPLQTIKQRLAAGEITEDEFERLKKKLSET